MDYGASAAVLVGSFLLMLALIGIGVPVGFALGLVGAAGVALFLSPAHLAEMANLAFQNGTNFVFVAVPLFILMAEVLTSAKFAELLFEAASRMLSRVPGALAISSVVACAGFGAVCGSSAATAATIGGPAIPEMIKRGYDKRLSVGAVAAGGTLGILIPPSIAMILFGIINQVSIGQLYIAGIVPGIVMTVLLGMAIALAVRLRPGLAPPGRSVTWAARIESLKGVWPFAVLSAAIIIPIYTGLATPTESAAIGAVAAIIYAVWTRRLTRAQFGDAVLRTVQTTSMIMFLLVGGFTLGFVFSSLGIPQNISRLIVAVSANRWVVIIMINVLFFLLGRYLDPLSIMVLIMPTLFPVVVQLGFDPVWFGIITVINTEIDNILPPDGVNLLVLKSIVPQDVSMDDIMLGSAPFVIVLIAGMALIMVFPELALWLPRQMK